MKLCNFVFLFRNHEDIIFNFFFFVLMEQPTFYLEIKIFERNEIKDTRFLIIYFSNGVPCYFSFRYVNRLKRERNLLLIFNLKISLLMNMFV